VALLPKRDLAGREAWVSTLPGSQLDLLRFRSLLLHDCLKVKEERAVVALCSNKEDSNVVPAVRLQYLCGLARDHEVLRACSNFQWAFQR